MIRQATCAALLSGMLIASVWGQSAEVAARRKPASADPILEWNEIALECTKQDHSGTYGLPLQGGPTRAARALAIVHVAMFDAANAHRRQYESYLTSGVKLSRKAMIAAVAQAAHDTLVALYPDQRELFDEHLEASLAGIGRAARRRGVSIGKQVARTVLDLRRDDGADLRESYVYGDNPGEHRSDPLNPDQIVLSSRWGEVIPFGIRSIDDFPVPPPPELTSAEYAAAFEKVKALGAVDSVERTPEQTEIGIFWGYDGTPGLGPPLRLYNQAVRTIALQRGNTIEENARLFALVNVAMADASICCWGAKYQYNFWRPVVAIREADEGTGPTGLGDGNDATQGDPEWEPLGAPASNQSGRNFTPPFPSYPSGHATFGAAVFRTLERFYGTDNISFRLASDEFNGITTDSQGVVRPVRVRRYDSFSQASEENAASRIFLGVHWSFDATVGLEQGAAIADYVYENLMQPRRRGK